MYLDYFGLTCKPFSITPDPRFIFLSAKHKEALAHLLYGIEQRSGFIELSGEVGAGKTTLLRTLLSECENDRYRTAFIFNPRLSALDLLRSINREFGISSDGSRSGLFHDLNQFLLEQNAAGRTVLLVVDEAQNLKTMALEEIRLLSNLETETDKLIQIVLVGQPELQKLLERSEIRQLNQRIAVRYHLQPLDLDETRRYIIHRLQIAGAKGAEIFSGAALKKIYRQSSGVPRHINILCDRLLLLAYSEDRLTVTAADVSRADKELRHGRSFSRTAGLRYALPTALIISFLVLTLLESGLWRSLERSIEQATQQHAAQVKIPVPTENMEVLRKKLAGMSEMQSLRSALEALTERWSEGAKAYEDDFAARNRRDMLDQFSLETAHFRGGFSQLLKLNVPSLVELSLPGVEGSRYLAVLAREGQRIFIKPELSENPFINIRQFERLWCGKALIPWRNHEDIPFLTKVGEEGEGIAALQRQLQACGLYGGDINGRYDIPTIEAVTRLQTATGIAADGRVGPQTLLVLYRMAGIHRQPSLSGGIGDLP